MGDVAAAAHVRVEALGQLVLASGALVHLHELLHLLLAEKLRRRDAAAVAAREEAVEEELEGRGDRNEHCREISGAWGSLKRKSAMTGSARERGQ
jgi:hypothetical protein